MGEKGERPERVFPGRTDPWFIAAMVIVAGGLSAACIACFLSSSPALLWGWLALLPIPALVALAALPVRSNRLELYGDRLVVVYAGTRSVIPYAHVRGVRRTRTLWAGTANSLDRVYIEAPYDGDAIVSVRDNDALVAELGAQVRPWARRLTPRKEERMDVPHWPYWRKYSLGGTQVWYADWGDCPFDTGLHEPS